MQNKITCTRKKFYLRYDFVVHVSIFHGPLLYVKGCNLDEVYFPLQRKSTLKVHTTSSILFTIKILCNVYIIVHFAFLDEFDLSYHNGL